MFEINLNKVCRKKENSKKYSGGDSNSHVFRHTPLKRTRLPVSPPEYAVKINIFIERKVNLLLLFLHNIYSFRHFGNILSCIFYNMLG